MAICEGAVRYWGPHSQPPGMMANTKITCRFPWAFAAAFCLNTSAWSLYTYPFCLQLSLFLRSGWRNIYKTSFDGALWVSDVWQDVSVSRALKRGWTSLEKIRIEHLLSRFLVFFFFFPCSRFYLFIFFPFFNVWNVIHSWICHFMETLCTK